MPKKFRQLVYVIVSNLTSTLALSVKTLWNFSRPRPYNTVSTHASFPHRLYGTYSILCIMQIEREPGQTRMKPCLQRLWPHYWQIWRLPSICPFSFPWILTPKVLNGVLRGSSQIVWPPSWTFVLTLNKSPLTILRRHFPGNMNSLLLFYWCVTFITQIK